MIPGLVIGKTLLTTLQRRTSPPAGTVVARTCTVMNGERKVERRKAKESSSTNKNYNPYTTEEIRNRLGGRSVRTLNKQVEKERIDFEEALKNEEWIPVYRFSGIRFGVLLARAKLLQTIASILYLPYSTFCYLSGTADATTFAATVFIAISAPALLFVFSRYLNRIIGVISMDESNEFIRIGYLTFWGARKNKYLEVADVIPLSETGSVRDQLVKLEWYSSGPNFLFLSTRNCEIVDESRARLLFGDIQMFDGYKKL